MRTLAFLLVLLAEAVALSALICGVIWAGWQLVWST